MANDNARDVDRAWELMKKIGFAMLVTHDGDAPQILGFAGHRYQLCKMATAAVTGARPEIGENRKVAL